MDIQDLAIMHKVQFQVWDHDTWWEGLGDDELGSCDGILSAGKKEDVCNLNHGKLYFKWEVKCVPGLGGRWCRDYVPSPMSKSFSSLYVSRHARPIPKAMLAEMGVFVNKPGWLGNETLAAERRRYDKM